MDDETIALKIFEKFHNRGFHPTTIFNHLRVQQGFESISTDAIMRGIVLLFESGMITLSHDLPYGDHYVWTETGQRTSIEELSSLFKKPVKELKIPLDIEISLELIDELRKIERARILLHLIENRLREFISVRLRETDKNWLETRIDPNIRKDWMSEKRKEQNQYKFRKLIGHELIYYSSFEQLCKIIKNNENWTQIFNRFFGKSEGIVNRIAETEGIRNTVMHNRMVSDDDLERLKRLYDDIMVCIEGLNSSLVSQDIMRRNLSYSNQEPVKVMRIRVPLWSEHMSVLREQAIDPWINYLKGAGRDTVIIGGGINIESIALGYLSVNHEVTTVLPKDPIYRYAQELFQHLTSGYPEQHQNWKDLKEDCANYVKEGQNIFEAIVRKLTYDLLKKTNLGSWNLRGQPPNEYFVSNYLSWIIYQDIYSIISYGVKSSDEKLVVIKDEKQKGLYYISKGAFARLAQGKKSQCEEINKIVDNLEQDKQLTELMEAHVPRRGELDKRLITFIQFLESLSKIIENQKPIQGNCDLCSS